MIAVGTGESYPQGPLEQKKAARAWQVAYVDEVEWAEDQRAEWGPQGPQTGI